MRILLNTKIVLGGALAIIALLFSGPVNAAGISHLTYPRTANIYLAPAISDAQAKVLARWDVVVLSAAAQDVSPGIFATLKNKNPDIVVLAYFPSNEMPIEELDNMESAQGPFHKIFNGISNKWWLRNTDGDIMSQWPGNQTLNVTQLSPKNRNGLRWSDYLPQKIDSVVMDTGKWDGVFYDSVWNSVAPFFPEHDLDLNRDGSKESASEQDAAWITGMAKIMTSTRNYIGANKYIVGNGGGNEYLDTMNGRLIENFPELFGEEWTQSMRYYAEANDVAEAPVLNIVNADTQGDMTFGNYQDMRYALTSTLLYDGFFSYDAGPVDHTQLWWYDELDADLGFPVSNARNLDKPDDSTPREGVWSRDFQNGTVFVNATSKKRTIQLPQRMQHLSGTQVPSINNGKTVDSITLKARDGVILLRTMALVAAPQDYAGDVITIDANAGSHLSAFQPYGPSFYNGVFLQVDDMNRDGENEIITIPARGSSHVRLFTSTGRAITPGFFAFGSGLENGGELTTVDLNGDGKKEIVVGTGPGLPPYVRIFDQNGVFLRQFFAYDYNYRGGVSVAAQDFNGDGIEEIVTGSKTLSAHVRVFGADGRALNAGFFAYPNFNGGIRVSVADLNGDDKFEILTAPTTQSDHVQIFGQYGRRLTPGFFAYNGLIRGVNMMAADLNGDQKLEILTGSNHDSTLVRQFDFEGRPLTPGFYVYDPSFLGGIMVQISR